ncbi:tryptophan synthase subunit alpha [Candidatus Kryptobacter tengchongensis]|uniref:Tryptophan synthase alpha chain n=1 Tax=Kryptobacter tengchongensis TaxID=1643429 RepID=A0A916LKS5_KRYT1|nr:tryptophan synthase subunit alpha [Candidatus Kryptobacter tengchongensis]CUT05490.1 tryptophan synthase, alpha chain [Candidatus Kryptobacter tengchongensis]
MNRIQNVLNTKNKMLIPYITPEFPIKGVTLPLLEGLFDAGSDMIEIGIPFSDPIADGPTIQHSSYVALKNGASFKKILDDVSKFRKKYPTPIILMGYYNSILSRGIENFVVEAISNGVDGVIVPDLPIDEADKLIEISQRYGLSNIFLVAPTSSDERIKLVSEKSTHFVYCVSVTGVTGEREEFGGEDFENFMLRVRANSNKPFVVGFGISKRDHVLEAWRWADGAVVGSALIKKLFNIDEISKCVKVAFEFISELKNGLVEEKK